MQTFCSNTLLFASCMTYTRMVSRSSEYFEKPEGGFYKLGFLRLIRDLMKQVGA